MQHSRYNLGAEFLDACASKIVNLVLGSPWKLLFVGLFIFLACLYVVCFSKGLIIPKYCPKTIETLENYTDARKILGK